MDRRPSTSTPPRTQAGTRSRYTVQAIRLYIQLFSEYHTEATSLRFLLLTLSSFVVLFTAKLALPRRSSDTQRCHSPFPTGGESISSVPTRSSVQLLPVGVWLAWNGFAPFSPSSSPQSPLVDAASALVLLLRSCHRAAHHSFSCSPPTAPPSSSSSPLPPFVQYFSFPLVHVLPRILVLTPQRIRRAPSGPAFHFARYPPQGKAYPDPEWSSRPSSLAIRCQEGVCGPRVVQAFIFTRYPPPRRRIRTPSGPAVPLHSLPAARKASPDPERSSRSSSVTIRCQEGVSGIPGGPAVHLTRYPPPRSRIRTPSGPAVHLYSPSAARKAYPDRGWFRRSSSLAIRRQEAYPDPEWSRRSSALAICLQKGVSGPRVVQPFIFTHCPPPWRRFQTATGPTVHLHSLSAARKAHPDPEWSSRSSSLAIRCQEGVSGPRLVQVIIVTRYPPPGSRTRTPSGPTVHLHSLSATRKAYPDPEWPRAFIRTRYPPPERRIATPRGPVVHLHSLSAARKGYPDPGWSSRSSSLAIRLQEGVSGPRVVQPFIFTRYPLPGRRTGPRVVQPFFFTRYPPPGRRILTPSGPGVHLHSLSAARKPYPDPDWSRRSSSLAIRLQKGVSGPRVVQPFIFTRSPLTGSRIETPDGPAVHLHSLSATGKAYPDRDWSYRSSSIAIRRQECAPRPRVVQPFIFTRYPLPGRRIRTATGPGDYLHSLSATKKPHPDPEWSSRSSSLAIRHQEGVSGPRVVQAFIRTRYPPPERRIRTLDGPAVHLHSLSASRKAYPDPEWSSRSSSLGIRCQEGVSGPRVVQPFIFTRYPPPGRRNRTPSCPGVHLHPLSAARKAYPDHERSRRLSSLAIRCQEGVSGPRVVLPFIFTRYPPPGRRTGTPSVQPSIFTRYPPPGRRIGTPSGPSVHLQSLSAARRAVPDRDWSRRSSSFVYPPPGRRIRSRGANRSS